MWYSRPPYGNYEQLRSFRICGICPTDRSVKPKVPASLYQTSRAGQLAAITGRRASARARRLWFESAYTWLVIPTKLQRPGNVYAAPCIAYALREIRREAPNSGLIWLIRASSLKRAFLTSSLCRFPRATRLTYEGLTRRRFATRAYRPRCNLCQRSSTSPLLCPL